MRRAVTTRSALVWSRRRDDPCFLEVRVGLADQSSRLRLRRSDGEVSPAGTVASVPVTLSLRLAPIGICGPRATSLALARWLVGQLAALHSPADLSLALVGRWRRRDVVVAAAATPLPGRAGRRGLVAAAAAVELERRDGSVDGSRDRRPVRRRPRRPRPNALEPGCANQVTRDLARPKTDGCCRGSSVVSVVGDPGPGCGSTAGPIRARVAAADDDVCIADQVSLDWAAVGQPGS